MFGRFSTLRRVCSRKQQQNVLSIVARSSSSGGNSYGGDSANGVSRALAVGAAAFVGIAWSKWSDITDNCGIVAVVGKSGDADTFLLEGPFPDLPSLSVSRQA